MLILDYERRTKRPAGGRWLPVVGMYAISFGVAAVIVHMANRLPQIAVSDDTREHIWGIPVNEPPASAFDRRQERADAMYSGAEEKPRE